MFNDTQKTRNQNVFKDEDRQSPVKPYPKTESKNIGKENLATDCCEQRPGIEFGKE